MPCSIVNESYDGLNALYSNAGDWKPGEVEFSTRFSVGSGTSNKFTYNSQGGNYSLSLDSGDIGDFGIVAGDVVTITWTQYNAPPAFQNQSETKTVTYVSGNIFYIDSPLQVQIPAVINVPDGTQFPTANQQSGMLVVANKAPDAVEFQFNLTPNGQQSLGSVLDGNLNRFVLQDVDLLPLLTPTAMPQIGDESGGWIKNILIEYLSDDGNGWRRYKITYDFFDWGIIQDGFSEPDYYSNADHLAPCVKLLCFSQYGNPNGVNEAISQNTEANTGGFDENYNGGANNYAVQSMSFEDLNNDPITAPDYSNEFYFTAVINAPNQANPNSTYNVGIVWRPIDASVYQGLPTNVGKNLMINAPEVDFIANGVVNPGPYLGETQPGIPSIPGSAGAKWDFEDLKFELTGVDELTVTGKIVPNAAAKILFDEFGTGERKTTIWLSISNYNLVGVNSDRVSLKLFDSDNYDAPTLGVQYPDVISETLLDHNDNDITAIARNTTTEDDVLYISELLLTDNVVYDGINTRIFVRNSSTLEEFELEQFFFDFQNVPYVSGRHELNETIPRGFNLPLLSDRNKRSLIRKPSLDGGGKYGVELQLGFLNNWRYWLAQIGVNNDFFDLNEPNNGLNRDWERYSEFGDWDLYIGYYVRLNGVDDYQEYKFVDRPYEDNPSVSFVPTFTVLSTGQTPTNLPSNEIVQIDAEFTWLGGNFDDWWTEIRVENKEGATLGVISSRWDQVNEPANPLKPLAGQTALYNVVAPANVLTASCLIDTNLVNVNEISLSYRVYSKPKGADFEYMVWETDVANLAYGLIKLSPNTVYPDASPCIRVYRQGDGATLDVGFVATGPGGQLELDTVSMLNFVNEFGADNGLVQWIYDQSGFGNNASQLTDADMGVIVNGGVLVTDSNGNPAISFNGASTYYNITNPVNNSQRYLIISSFERPAGIGIKSVGFADVAASPYVFQIAGNDDILTFMGAAFENHGTTTKKGDMILSTLRNSADDIKIWIDTTPKTTRNSASVVNSITTLGNINNADYHNGLFTTAIYYTSDFESFRFGLVETLNNYYNYY